ncbi:CUT domain protein [Onchocerca flexuosa]|uniref:Homeobox protein cut-like n=1 Tax=Onchocerca flexuosa TaxID=387005 RepID=A0A238BTU8_9BILA|nr:CUT domain protein [Onchocerca flexuosa]
MATSQGSLSELLSKPRHWNKLTDKGREAFRRMYGWVSDPKAIELLCNISPRRTQPVAFDFITGTSRLIEIEVPSREILWDQQAVSLAAVSRYNADNTLDLFVQKQSSRFISEDKNFIFTIINLRLGLKQRDRLSAAAAGSGANSVIQRTSRWRHDDIPKEKIMKIYKRELALLREQESHLEQAIGSRPLSMRSKDEKLSTMETSNKSSSLSSSSSRCGSTRDTSSPPQSNFPVNSAQALFALKCRSGMASITQEELERYPVLDTEDIVRQIKDFLCLNSISQRQFGEHVLGLSQGSVSDLLARPKPWAMLTQKGREPFVRMQLFLNEAQSLVCKSEAELNGNFGAIQSAEVMSKNEASNGAKQNSINGLLSMRNFPLVDEIDHETMKYHNEKAREIKKMSTMDDDDKKMMRNMKKELLMADTSEIARQVKDRLHSNGISQKTFGDVVLGVSPGGVSELLAKPKTWEQLSPRARDLYRKMSEWLGELDGNKRIQETSTSAALLSSSLTTTFSSTVDTMTSTGALAKTLSLQKRKASLNTTAAGEIPKKAQRTVITDQQKEALKHVFERDQHPNQRTIEQLSQTLSLSTRTVSNWFHNYRTRQKASLRAENLSNGENSQKRNPANGKNNNDRWKQDLAELMKLESKPYHWSPTMVSSNSNCNLTRSTITKNSSLDKAIERIQKLNAAKQLSFNSAKQLIAAENAHDNHEKELFPQRELIARKDGNESDSNSSEFSVMKMLVKELAVSVRQRMSAEKESKDISRLIAIWKMNAIKYVKTSSNFCKIENDAAEMLYEDKYEKHLDPFRKFNFQEIQLLDFSMSFIQELQVLYRFAYTESSQRDFQTDYIAKSSVDNGLKHSIKDDEQFDFKISTAYA